MEKVTFEGRENWSVWVSGSHSSSGQHGGVSSASSTE